LAAIDFDVDTLEHEHPAVVRQRLFLSSTGEVPLPLFDVKWSEVALTPVRIASALVYGGTGEVLELMTSGSGAHYSKRPRELIKDQDALLAIPDSEFLTYSLEQRAKLLTRFLAITYPPPKQKAAGQMLHLTATNATVPQYSVGKAANGETPLRVAGRETRSLPPVDPQFYASAMARLTNMTSSHRAALEGRRDVVEALLSSNVTVDAKTAYGDTPLDFAALKGHKDIVEMLLAKGADVNAKTLEGFTPLFMATVEGHKEVVELLLTKGASPNVKTRGGWTPLDMAALQGEKIWLEEVLGVVRDFATNHFSALCQVTPGAEYKEVVELLLAKGAKVNASSSEDHSALYLAALRGHTDVVELLLAHQANVNARDSEGSTPLAVAAACGNKSVVELLLTHHADINNRDDEGRTALFGAARGDFKDVVELLLARGADVNARDRARATPLGYVVSDKVGKDMEEVLRQHGGRQ
jgi:ankyrin repeat protein